MITVMSCNKQFYFFGNVINDYSFKYWGMEINLITELMCHVVLFSLKVAGIEYVPPSKHLLNVLGMSILKLLWLDFDIVKCSTQQKLF